MYEDLHQRRDALLSANSGLTPAANGSPAPKAADGERGQALRRSCSSFKRAPSLDPGACAPLCAATSDTIVHVIRLCPSHTSFGSLPAWLAVHRLPMVLLRSICKGMRLLGKKGGEKNSRARRRYTPKFAVSEGVAEPVEEMAAVLDAMAAARALARRNAGLVRAQPTWTEKQARLPCS